MSKTYAAVIDTPFTRIGIDIAADAIVALDFNPRLHVQAARSALAREAVAQIRAYCRDPKHRFSLPLVLTGTPYQQKVWRALCRIPSGACRSYGELARTLDSGARAIGGACRLNPIPLIVPCHRVVAANGLGGYSGATAGAKMSIKRWLLAHERRA